MNTSIAEKQNLDKVALDFVRYANVWEDAEVLLKGLAPSPGQRILSVCAAGDNCFALLSTEPELVLGVDVNPAQLYLTQLKAAAIRRLEYDRVLAFLGFTPSVQRSKLFKEIKSDLPLATRRYWEERMELIERGIIHCGKFEKYFRLFAERFLPFVHTQEKIEKLLSEKSEEAQATFYHKEWNKFRWHLLFKLFFSRRVMGSLGRDPAFFEQVQGSVAKEIYRRSADHLSSKAAQSNPFLHYIFQGNFGGKLPFYLRPENFAAIRNNLDRLKLCEGYVQEAGRQFRSFHAMNLSNIFEYMPAKVFKYTTGQLAELAAPGCRFGYWNLLVSRIMAEVNQNLIHHAEYSAQLSKNDQGFFYAGFKVDEKV